MAGVVPLGAVPIMPNVARQMVAEKQTDNTGFTVPDKINKLTQIWQKKQTLAADCSADNSIEGSQTFKLFLEPDPLSNMILVVEGVELHVHKEVLAGWSPVFMAMFTSNFLETEQNRVVLSGKSLADVQLLLNCLCPPITCQVTRENVLQLLPLVEEYGISALKSQCEAILKKFEPDLEMILYAYNFNMPDLLDEAITGCSELPFAAIDHQKHKDVVEHIPAEVILNIYREKILRQGDALKTAKKAKEAAMTIKNKVAKWGTGKNCYPCEKHRNMNEQCVLCMSAFRSYVFSELESLSEKF